MARAQFEKHQVLKNSSDAFWRLGYNATSMQVIFEKTGLKPGSVYLAFGNKEGLFKEALNYYAQQSIARVTSSLEEANVLEESICLILLGFVDDAFEQNYCSCFLVKSQLELSGAPDLQAYAIAHLRDIESVYAHFLGKKYSMEDAKIKATSLMMHIFGIRVYGYHQTTKSQMIAGLQSGLPWLPWERMISQSRIDNAH
ncbi:TetR/AcrR family transcriptional regulator [Marinomonas algicola]|uniref:TetR/AcrR family transcriptional regulator n=1 Tax=Marinomonas algicola TaxID=2773454 RepID=UPI001748BBDF|nr:TetR/AcrR family transcriptional regulator [Marinomonas algicola]